MELPKFIDRPTPASYTEKSIDLVFELDLFFGLDLRNLCWFFVRFGLSLFDVDASWLRESNLDENESRLDVWFMRILLFMVAYRKYSLCNDKPRLSFDPICIFCARSVGKKLLSVFIFAFNFSIFAFFRSCCSSTVSFDGSTNLRLSKSSTTTDFSPDGSGFEEYLRFSLNGVCLTHSSWSISTLPGLKLWLNAL